MTWNPFNWTAGPFLALYIFSVIVVILLTLRFRSMIGPPAQAIYKLSVLELAYLAGGAHRLGDAILFSLTSGNGASIDPNGYKITVTDQSPLAPLIDRPPVLLTERDMTRKQFQSVVKPIVEQVQRRLKALGYHPTDDQMACFRKTVLPFVGFLLVFGMIKIFVGIERHHPIGFLVALLVLTAFGGIALLVKTPMRTRAGKDALQTYQTSHARASRAPLDHELLLAVALSGAVVLLGTQYASIYGATRIMNNGGACGSGGCSGGGGGCGGCGG